MKLSNLFSLFRNLMWDGNEEYDVYFYPNTDEFQSHKITGLQVDHENRRVILKGK